MRNQTGTTDLMGLVILIPIALILVAALGGVAIDLVFNISGTAQARNLSAGEGPHWQDATATLWNLLPLIMMIVLILAFIGVIGLKITGSL